MKPRATIITILIVIAIVILFWWLYSINMSPSTTTSGIYPPTSTPAGTGTGTNPSNTMTYTVSDGTISFSYPSPGFGLATNAQQILVSSYIPPCDDNFNYCLYDNDTSTYAGTNFESAGIRIDNRTDLKTQSGCLTTQPTGFTGLKPNVIATTSAYAIAEFPNVGGAAAGHFAAGSLYRLFYSPSGATGNAATGSCYEFETRIGQSDYLNYPSGSIQQFTPADEAAVSSSLQSILATVTLPGSTTVAFPQ